MKMLFFSIIIILIIITSGMFIKLYLKNKTLQLNREIITINQLIEKGDWNYAHKITKILNDEWNSTEGKWALFINHHEIDSISSSLIKATQYVKYNDKENSSVYLSELKEYIDHIPDMEKLSLKNIF